MLDGYPWKKKRIKLLENGGNAVIKKAEWYVFYPDRFEGQTFREFGFKRMI